MKLFNSNLKNYFYNIYTIGLFNQLQNEKVKMKTGSHNRFILKINKKTWFRI
jgi:hypothetical protein